MATTITTATTTTVTASTKQPPSPQHRSRTTPLQPPRSASHERLTTEKPEEKPSNPPYLHLLMPEPPRTAAAFLFRGRREREWRSLPVFLPEEEGNVGPALRALGGGCEEEGEEGKEDEECEYDSSPMSPTSIRSEEGPAHTRYLVVRSKTL
ncbi:hypothetical protein B0A55_06022 [Friedmanniomyces simplex]|uniref:Uncharacterized protein n=1 Tax=Friedmanniomyces simplex TaxID=329884 RepID=A0A4V5NGS6_9PEZI|nr:hypothetical protein B0A55_06022 [Friedmanniomyces simplex]